MPEVSVIIPNYNHAAYLKQRIDSVLEQTYQDFEIIILDDCSTDSSREVIEQYSYHKKITNIVYNDINSGSTFRQWLKGIGLSSGKYIWIAESDDWCEPTFLEHVLAPFMQETDCNVSYCQSYCIVDQEIKAVSMHLALTERVEGKRFVRDYMLSGNSIYNASMAVWRKEAFAHVSSEFIKYKYCGDWLFWVELSLQGSVQISGRVLNYFRKHGGDVTGKALASGNNYVEEVTLLNDFYKKGWIDKKVLTGQLTKRFYNYSQIKHRLKDRSRPAIEKSFFLYISRSSLFSNYLIYAIKYKVYLRLKLLIEVSK